jgi:hypothetical protein
MKTEWILNLLINEFLTEKFYSMLLDIERESYSKWVQKQDKGYLMNTRFEEKVHDFRLQTQTKSFDEWFSSQCWEYRSTTLMHFVRLDYAKYTDDCRKIKEAIDKRHEPESKNILIETVAPQSALDVQVGGDHYKKMKIQPIEFIEGNKLPFIEGCIVKYICRHEFKNGVQDLEKAKHLIEILIEKRYGKQ